MARVIVVGGGLAGCAAAAAAARAGAIVTLLERAELLGGWALFAGRIDHKYFTVREELRLMGGNDIFGVLDNCTLHQNVKFPWPKPLGATKTIYNITKLDPELRKHLESIGVEVRTQSRAKDVGMDGRKIQAVVLDDGTEVASDAFVDATGGTGGLKNCQTYGNGCALCFQRCPAFGDRVSVAGKAGVKELIGKKLDGSLGAVTAAFALLKESLAPEVKEEMERAGIVSLPVPPHLINYKRTENITASGNIDKGFAENIVLVDIGGYAKRIAGGYTPLDELRKVPGLERALYADPYAGTIGNGIRYMAITPRGDALDVPGVENLFVASEKLGVNGVGEVTATGVIAGHNAARKAMGMASLVLPTTTMLGGFIAYANQNWNTEKGLRERFHLFTGPYLRMAEETGLYTEDKDTIKSRMEDSGLMNILSQ